MKKYSLIIIAFLLFIACDDIPNSDFIGKWQLKTIERNGQEMPVDTVWYNFQSESVFSVQVYVPQKDAFYVLLGLRTQSDNVISITLESESYLEYSDWNSTNRSFSIDKIDRKSMILRSEEGYRYSFIKF